MESIAIDIVTTLQKAGFEAYFAGGSVRDLLMGKDPEDYDIATSARPEDIERLMPKTIPVGKQFGVMIAVLHGHHFEVATFRSDSSYSDGRRPDAVMFTTAEEDASRRDFTINGMFYDPIKKKVLDYVDGQKDIQAKVIRFIGAPHERIKEDHLRILRAIRFKNQFGFRYATITKKAIEELAELAADVSKERAQDEITKMLMAPTRSHAIRELDKFGILERLLPEVSACKGVEQPVQYHQEGDVFTHLLMSLHNIDAAPVNKELVWAVFLHDIGKPKTYSEEPDRIHFNGHAPLSAKMTKDICKRLKFSNAETTKICWLIENHMQVGYIPTMRRAHQVKLFWNPWFEDLMRLNYADAAGSLPLNEKLHDDIMKLYREFKDMKLLEEHYKPLLDGDDLMKEFKLDPGPALREILESLHFAQIEGDVKNKDEARAFVKKIIQAMG